MAQTITKRAWEVLKTGAGDALILYPSLKLTGAVDSAAKNLLPAGIPQEIRTPLVGVLLAAIPQLLSKNKLADRFSSMLMASALVHTIQLAGNKGTGLPGPIDQAVNKVLNPIAQLGAGTAGSTQGYIGHNSKLRGYTPPTKMRGYTGVNMVTSAPHSASMKGNGLRQNQMRGYMSEYR